jgi:hypothetical protein
VRGFSRIRGYVVTEVSLVLIQVKLIWQVVIVVGRGNRKVSRWSFGGVFHWKNASSRIDKCVKVDEKGEGLGPPLIGG